MVLYKVNIKVEGGVMASRWERGIWLGKRFGTDEHIVSSEDGSVARSPAAKIHPDGQWNRELFDGIRGSPWNPSGTCTVEGESNKDNLGEAPKEAPQAEEIPVSRGFKITRKILDAYGFTK